MISDKKQSKKFILNRNNFEIINFKLGLSEIKYLQSRKDLWKIVIKFT